MWNNFVGTASPAQVDNLTGSAPWANVFLSQIPFETVHYPPTYMFAVGSANISNPTTSVSGIVYNAGIDLYRWDNNCSDIDFDRYLIHPFKSDVYRIYFTKPPHHHVRSINDVPTEVPLSWRKIIQKKLK